MFKYFSSEKKYNQSILSYLTSGTKVKESHCSCTHRSPEMCHYSQPRCLYITTQVLMYHPGLRCCGLHHCSYIAPACIALACITLACVTPQPASPQPASSWPTLHPSLHHALASIMPWPVLYLGHLCHALAAMFQHSVYEDQLWMLHWQC